VTRSSRGAPADRAASLLRAYSASARISQYLVQRLDPAVWRATLRGAGGTGEAGGTRATGSGRPKTIASLVAHIHNCGLRYLERTDPTRVPPELDRFRVTPAEAVRALGAKRRIVLDVVGAALREGRRIVGFPHDATTYLAYYLSHDSHHRGQIVMLARLLGRPIDRDTMSGMWQWAARARE
jgi:uncharacterized damage-inducible protein DinB